MNFSATRFSNGSAKVRLFSEPPNLFLAQKATFWDQMTTQLRNTLKNKHVHCCYNFVK